MLGSFVAEMAFRRRAEPGDLRRAARLAPQLVEHDELCAFLECGGV
jgi:hypothetical protein